MCLVRQIRNQAWLQDLGVQSLFGLFGVGTVSVFIRSDHAFSYYCTPRGHYENGTGMSAMSKTNFAITNNQGDRDFFMLPASTLCFFSINTQAYAPIFATL